ncbi:zf-HC2 domain-containing protein [Frankia sp. EAN1pec]|uniref:zf-HC2 domain-containing protein n=1 Tax=Parafrankia sp. (strain EAN1pec) TaxID=298653 RepID=UPI00031EE7D9
MGAVTDTCSALRVALGCYVLGALAPGERAAVETHLDGCPDCRAELTRLAGLPGLLSRLRLADVTDPPPAATAGEPGPGARHAGGTRWPPRRWPPSSPAGRSRAPWR